MSSERNIIIEGDFDFWKELDDESDDNQVIGKELCELTREPLTKNYITLPCGHKFNYKPLCLETINLKNPKNVKSMTRYLGYRQICCPYCRQIFNKLLPIIPNTYVGVPLPKYVASKTCCIKHRSCEYEYKSGKNKGKKCGCNGFDSEYGPVCCKHWSMVQRKKQTATKIRITKDKLNDKALKLFNSMKVIELKETLKANGCKVSGTKATLADRLSKLNI
tara:strand:+ start:1672 stop:2331 length:660 start_codon:yes stop_codon:yes gene_type:complete